MIKHNIFTTGPFLGKNFGTTVSPWIVTLDALEEFLVDGPSQTEPAPLKYLQENKKSAYDIDLEVQIKRAYLANKETYDPTMETN